jgi:hypothetical protein
MKLAVLALTLVSLVGGAAQAASAPSPLMDPIHTFIDNFDKGDVQAAGRAYAADVSIIDEVPPHVWRGPTALTDWAASLQQDAQAKSLTEEGVSVGSPTRAEINGSHGYVVVPATFKFRDHGAAMAEPAQMVFGLINEGGAWKISSWAWTGTTPKPATASAP